jgi:hypothetical protein
VADGNLVQFNVVTNITNTPMHHVVVVEGEMRAKRLKLKKNVGVLFVELQKNQQL